jgi:DNA invertase Pin-like site-specific DNA recombinase
MSPSLVLPVAPRKVGYVRVSTNEQETALQLAALRGAGCTDIFEEKISGAKDRKPALDACLDSLRQGDTLVVWKLDRLGRTTVKLLDLVEDLEKRGIFFQCTTQGMDTGTPMGKLMLTILAGFAEFERSLTIERTINGLEAARAAGHFGGRRRKVYGEKLERAREAYFNRPLSPVTGKKMTNDELAKMFGIAKPTLQRWCLHGGVPTWGPQREAFQARNPDYDEWLARTEDPMNGTNPNKRTM